MTKKEKKENVYYSNSLDIKVEYHLTACIVTKEKCESETKKLERREKRKENMHARDKPKLNPEQKDINIYMRTVFYTFYIHTMNNK